MIDVTEFRRRAASGQFALHWEAYGLHYGIPVVSDEWLRSGKTVVVNGSRGILETVRQKYGNRLIVNVTAPAEQIVERLRRRAREEGIALEQRLARQNICVTGEDVLQLDNSGPTEIAGEQLLRALLATEVSS